MKVLILVLILSLGLIHPVLSQEVDSLSQRETLLELSKKQKKTGFILLGGGVGAAVIGGALFASNFCLFGGCSSQQDALAGTGGILFILGVGSAIASIPVLINSGKTARRAMELSVKSSPIYLPPKSHNGPKSYPALQLSIPLN
ncbi:hypothetical protein D0X99_04245 [Algoriphagus lacus]|uniref:Uncharacterized protein n=1 Tax=Algoriphagus lacus TaxID=2056311 RepID=A0A418PTT9_9BACT|nr:hypothetical protein [Algoriphagus lacus]RIW16992.1 hypothetical protein D0X99_04245 [Algoriphagus lacus]